MLRARNLCLEGALKGLSVKECQYCWCQASGCTSVEPGRIDEYGRRAGLQMVAAILDGDVCVKLLRATPCCHEPPTGLVMISGSEWSELESMFVG